MIIATNANANNILHTLCKEEFLAIDTETTGLKWYAHNQLFSIIITTAKEVYYFNFQDYNDINAPFFKRDFLHDFYPLFSRTNITWFIHNAKFDMGMLAREGLSLAGTIHCTEAMARLLFSAHPVYSLDMCLKRMNRVLRIKGVEKSDAVKEYVKKHKLYTEIHIAGKKKPIKESYYHKVPYPIMKDYAEKDGRGGFNLGMYQRDELIKLCLSRSAGLANVIRTERQITKVFHKMEFTGIALDQKYNAECKITEMEVIEKVKAEWLEKTGEEFVDSNIKFAKLFTRLKVPFPRTEKGNPSFAKEALKTMDSPLTDIIKKFRSAEKRVATYYSSFEYYGQTGRIHAGVRQSGTAPGRVSYASPNLQNIPKPDSDKGEESYRARRCFLADPNYCLFMPDFDQMEYRMMLDMAGEKVLIDLIQHEGLDVHSATAEIAKVTRNHAKTVNFLLLYGGGDALLAKLLGISLEEAVDIKRRIFAKLIHVDAWIKRTISQAKMRGYTINWAGRICRLPRNFAYKAPNYIIQGGCADVMKRAMVKIDEFLVKNSDRSKMVIQVHDELIFNLYKKDLHYAKPIIDIMESIYPHRYLKLTVGSKYSWTNWADHIGGYPSEETRNEVQGKSTGGSEQIKVPVAF